MKKLIFGIGLLWMFGGVFSLAEEVEENAALADTQELVALERFLDLSDEELARMQTVIERLRKMSPEEKKALKEKILEFKCLRPAQRERIRRGWGARNGFEGRDQWREMMRSLPLKQRQDIQSHLRRLNPREKAEYKQQLINEFNNEN